MCCLSYLEKKNLFEFITESGVKNLQVYSGMKAALKIFGMENAYTDYSIQKVIRNKTGMELALTGDLFITPQQKDKYFARLEELVREEFAAENEKQRKYKTDYRLGFSIVNQLLSD